MSSGGAIKAFHGSGAAIAPGGDLLGNHPVAVPYPDTRGASYNAITTAADPSGYVFNPAGVKLYGPSPGRRGIECGSCHDIHGKARTRFMLRVPYATL